VNSRRADFTPSSFPETFMTLALGALVILAAIYAVSRQGDVRLVLTLAALALGTLAGQPMAIVRKFLETFSNEQFVVPICCAVGFAYVMREAQCDQHLVRLLVRPLRRVPILLVPGTVLVGFLVNIPVISQVGTGVCIGAVLIPLLRAARLSPLTIGAALLLGASLGGDLLNPGAPEWRTVSTTPLTPKTPEEAALLGVPEASSGQQTVFLTARDCVRRTFPLQMIQLGVATAVFWALSLRWEARYRKQAEYAALATTEAETLLPLRVNYLKAAVPLLPVALLFMAGPPLEWIRVPREWLASTQTEFDSRLIGAAMLVGTVAAALVGWRSVPSTAKTFFEGAGYGFTHIISVIVAANCFGKAVELIGVARVLGEVIGSHPAWLLPIAGGLSLAFAVLCGSGMATTQSLYGFFAEPALRALIHPAHVGAVVAIAASAGRTMSPVAAITLYCSLATGTQPFELVRRVAVPLLAAVVVMVTAAIYLGGGP
jgi:DcuC family C4-dicarboxylate transporter